jgi:hypothetical protein
LEFLWSFEFSKRNFKGENLLDWGLTYTIENLLKHRCLKWVHMIHLSTYNTSYGQKKGQGSKSQFDSWQLKVRNDLDLGVCKECDTSFKRFRWGL